MPVPCISSDEHRGHDPETEVDLGVPVPIWEVPARAERIENALRGDAGFWLGPARAHGLDPIEAVHDPGLVAYLSEAWTAFRREAPNGRQAIADTFLHPALREGMGAGRPPASGLGRLGYWSYETMTPIVEGTFAAARAAVDVALTALDLVLAGDPLAYGLCRPPGHHAPRAAFGGFCYFNNAAIVADQAVRATHGQVAVLDVDYHHGNGTQQIFYERGDVLYVSLHGDPDRAYPYFLGSADETGSGAGAGCTSNHPLPVGCDDRLWFEHLESAIQTIDRFAPDLVVVSLGVDTYHLDPLSDLAVTAEAFHHTGRAVHDLARPTVVVQEGGYHLDDLGANVARWLRGAAGLADAPLAAPSLPSR